MKRIDDETVDKINKITRSILKKMNLSVWTPVWDYDDMLQVGTLAALRAYDRFDSEQGDFITYCYTRIRGAMIDEMRRLDWRPRPMIENKEANEYEMFSINEPCKEFDLQEYEIPVDYNFDKKLELDLIQAKLTKRPKIVFEGLRVGKSQQEMCEELKCSRSSIADYQKKIYQVARAA